MTTDPAALKATSARIDRAGLAAYSVTELRAALRRGKDSEPNRQHRARIVEELRRRGERI